MVRLVGRSETVKIEKIKEQLKAKGYKLTPQRRAILEVIMDNKGSHLSTEEIYDQVKVNCPDIGLATVYRTLQLLSEIEILSKMTLDDGLTRYEMNVNQDEHQHHHLICLECNKIIEFQGDLLDELEHKIEEDLDFTIKDHKLKFYGICADCKKQ